MKRHRKIFYNYIGEHIFIDVDFPPLIEKYLKQDERKASEIMDIALREAFNESSIDIINFLVRIGMFKNKPDVIRYAVTSYINKNKKIIVSGSKECTYY